jgi:hypothetical protein
MRGLRGGFHPIQEDLYGLNRAYGFVTWNPHWYNTVIPCSTVSLSSVDSLIPPLSCTLSPGGDGPLDRTNRPRVVAPHSFVEWLRQNSPGASKYRAV